MRSDVHEPSQSGRGHSTVEAGVVDYRLGRTATDVPIAPGGWIAGAPRAPLFTKYPWLPRPVLRWYAEALPRLDCHGWIRKFGVSTVVVAEAGDGQPRAQ